MNIWTPDQPLPECAKNHSFFNWITDSIAICSYEATLHRDILDIEGIKHIVSIGSRSAKHDGITTRHFRSINDDEYIPDGIISNVLSIIDLYSRIGKTIVHCAAGVSRSPGFVITHLCLKNGWEWDDAEAYVDERRPCFVMPETKKCLQAYIERHRHEDN